MKNSTLYARYFVFATSLVAMLGSLYLSQVMHLPPCALCWYQRIFMYPLAFIMLVGILRRDPKMYQYVLPLASTGWAIALYHTLLQWKIIPENLLPCVQGVACTTVQINLLGFITIPFMSLVTFSVIIIAAVIEWRTSRESRS